MVFLFDFRYFRYFILVLIDLAILKPFSNLQKLVIAIVVSIYAYMWIICIFKTAHEKNVYLLTTSSLYSKTLLIKLTYYILTYYINLTYVHVTF